MAVSGSIAGAKGRIVSAQAMTSSRLVSTWSWYKPWKKISTSWRTGWCRGGLLSGNTLEL